MVVRLCDLVFPTYQPQANKLKSSPVQIIILLMAGSEYNHFIEIKVRCVYRLHIEGQQPYISILMALHHSALHDKATLLCMAPFDFLRSLKKV